MQKLIRRNQRKQIEKVQSEAYYMFPVQYKAVV